MSKETAVERKTKQISFQCPVELYDEFVKLEIAAGHRRDAEFVKSVVNDHAESVGSDFRLPISR